MSPSRAPTGTAGPESIAAATYGQLSALGLHLTVTGGQRAVLNPGPGAALVGSYRSLLAALTDHAHRIVAADRYRHRRDWPLPAGLDPRAARFLHVLPDPALAARQARRGGGVRSRAPFAAAVRAWRGADELLATHFTPAGVPRGPDATWLDDPDQQLLALARVAAATVVLLDTAEQLRHGDNAAADPGLAAALATLGGVVDGARLRTVAAELAAAVPAGAPGGWPDQTVARPGPAHVPGGDRWRDLTVRVRRLRMAAWDMTRDEVSARSLGDLALAAIVVHRLACDLASPQLDWSPGATGRPRAGLAAWVQVRDQLHQLHTLAVPAPGLRVEVRALLQLSTELAQVRRLDRDQVAAVTGAVDSFTQIAAWNRAGLARAAADGRVYVRGRYLRGDEVCDDPEMVTVKLRDGLARAPQAHLDPVLSAYRQAAALSTGPTPATSPLRTTGIDPRDPITAPGLDH